MHAPFIHTRPNSVRFLFVGLVEERSLQKKVDTRNKLLSRILDAADSIKISSDEQLAIFAYESHSTLSLTGFLNIYCEL